MAKLSDFMVSRVRVKLYRIFYDNPSEMYYVRELTRMAKEEINAIRRELDRMDKKGILRKESRGNRLYYSLNPDYSYYEDLLSMVTKAYGLGHDLIKNRSKLGKVKIAMVSGKFARRQDRDHDDVDLLVVGDIVLPELGLLVQKEEKRLNLEINYTVMTADEFEFRKSRRDPFLTKILLNSRVMIIGDQLTLTEKKSEDE